MDAYRFVNFVVSMISEFIDTINSVVLPWRYGGATYSIPIFYLVFACIIFSIVISLFVRSGKG